MVIAIVSLLAAMLLPALARAKRLAQRTSCLSQLRQQAVAWRLYLDDAQNRFPDRRDLKTSLPGGFKPWSTWPKSDPRCGWAVLVLSNTLPEPDIWSCPSLRAANWGNVKQAAQPGGSTSNAPVARYWMWRFDHTDDPVTPDNFWGRTEMECVTTLQADTNSPLATGSGPAEVELTVDVYFPNTVPSLEPELKGRSAHPGGRNR
ncbi:MAG TPA: hypothetical protein VNT26_21135, partial [Candidatus Sulfotelmatobacter sp.]|nr:hypothetical protein [Candidatus Sulfotelmatobacter sp.]